MTQQVFDMEKFQEQGYLVARDVLDPEVDLAPVFTEYEELLDRLSRMWLQRGTISNAFEGLPFNERLVQIAIATRGNYYPYVDISFTQTDVEERMPVHSGPAVFNLLRSPRMLDAVEQFIGPEIYCNPVQHVRIKPPETALPEDMLSDSSVGYTAWHQDQGVIIPDADESDILTVWLPVIEATEENGCMVVVPGSHRAGLVPHCPPKPNVKHVHILEERLGGDAIPVPLKPGDVLFMHKLTMHCSLPNRSNDIRWSFDLRYNPIGQATGRPWFPGFVARSKADPESVLSDPDEWATLWERAGEVLAKSPTPAYNRWRAGDPLCA